MYLSFILQTFVEQEKTYQKISRRRNRRHLCWPRSTGSTPNRRLHQVYLYNKLYLLVYCQLVETHFITTYISVSSQSHECTSLSCHYVAYSIERRDLTRPVVVGRLTGRSISAWVTFFFRIIGTINNITLYRSDISALDTTEWLNKNIINACAGYVQSVDQYMYMCLTIPELHFCDSKTSQFFIIYFVPCNIFMHHAGHKWLWVDSTAPFPHPTWPLKPSNYISKY